jgi:hypothetical protein
VPIFHKIHPAWFGLMDKPLHLTEVFSINQIKVRRMKRNIIALSFMLISTFTQLFGQNEYDLYTPISSAVALNGMEVDATLVSQLKPNATRSTNPNLPEAMFDVQFLLRANDSLGAGIARRTYCAMWTGTEFWMAQWTSDSIARFTQSGKLLGYLKVANLPATTGNIGVRGLSKEGNNIWAVNTSNFIMRLDPTTGQILESINGPAAAGGLRFAAWDPTEGGGFWVGNLSSDLYKVSKTGAIIRTIPRGTHGLVAMGGVAYDDVSVGGPFLWVNCQSDFVGTGYGSTIVRQIQLSTGIGTAVLRDAKTNIPAITNSNLGGGITIATLPGFTKPSLIVTVQNTPTYSGAVIGYELDFVKPATIDMGLDSLDLVNGFSIMPLRHRNPALLRVKTRNLGFAPIATTSIVTEIYRNLSSEFIQTNTTAIPALSLLSLTTGGAYVPTATGSYAGYSYGTTTGDGNPLNDTATVNFAISDSTYATDNADVPSSFITGLSISGTGQPGQKRLGMNYRLPIASTINSVSILFRPQFADDSVQIKIYRIVNGIPSDSIGSSPFYVTTTGDAGATYTIRTLPLTKPLTVAANQEFVICLTEGRGSMRLASTLKGYRPQSMWAYGTFWINTDTLLSASFRAALYLRPNISIRVGTNDVNSNISTVKAFPNPTTGALSVSVQLKDLDNTTIGIYDVAGRLLIQDKTIDNQSFTKNIPLHNLPSGMYILKVATAKGTWQEKIFKE